MKFNRRRFLEISGLAAGGVALRSVFAPSLALANDDPSKLVLAVYFSGGGDHLLTLDPRPNDDPDYTSNEPSSKTAIFPAYDRVSDTNTLANLAASGPYKGHGKKSGIKQAGNLTFGPAVPEEFWTHYEDIALLRGVFMGTLGHEVGRRYFITGKFPRGLAASGSSLATEVASSGGMNGATVPNLAISCEAYNETFPAYASPVGVSSSKDVLNLLKQLGTPLDTASEAALLAYQDRSFDCAQQRLDGTGAVTLFHGSQQKARKMVDSTAAAQFNFTFSDNTPPDVADLLSYFGCTTNGDLSLGKGRAALAARALTTGISQGVSLQIASDLDDHSDWADTHATTLWDGYWALGKLISYLKKTPYKGGSTMTWDHTTLLVFSEFARTPLLNGRQGRDHNIASSALVAGPGIKGNQIIGATSASPDDTSAGAASAPGMVARNVDFSTGKPDDKNGLTLRPQDIHATVLTSMGLPYDQLLNQSPRIIKALLK
jgi:uncharacterized protein (DUF1501 family)